MSLTSYQAAPPCNKGTRKVLIAYGTVNAILGFSRNSRNSRLPAVTAPGVLAGSLLEVIINQTTNRIHRSQGGPSADLCLVRYIRSL